ncbi:MAG TPA: hypothetical protein O0X27_06730 [Methanocorpusculum sp.]|nr:hypothetical protein [Methanocorpusculum sp.]
MGFLDTLKTTAKSEVDSAKRSLRISQLKGERADLERAETEIYAVIGRLAYEEFGQTKYAEESSKLQSLHERIVKKNEEIAELESLS